MSTIPTQSDDNHDLIPTSIMASSLSQLIQQLSSEPKSDLTPLLAWSEKSKARLSVSSISSSSSSSSDQLTISIQSSVKYLVSRLEESSKALNIVKRTLNSLLDLLDILSTSSNTIRLLLDLSIEFWNKKPSTELIELLIKRYGSSKVLQVDPEINQKLLREVDSTSRRAKCSISLLTSAAKELGIDSISVIKSKNDEVEPQDSSMKTGNREKWETLWLKALTKRLIENELFREYLSIYHLESLFTIDSLSFTVLLKSLCRVQESSINQSQILPSILSVLRAGNRRGLSFISDDMKSDSKSLILGSEEFMTSLNSSIPPMISIPTSLLLSCAVSSSSELQISAVTLSIETKDQKFLPSLSDYRVLKSGLTNGLAESDAKTRNQTNSLTMGFFERLKIATHATKKEIEKLEKKEKRECERLEGLREQMSNCKRFLEWFHKVLILENLDVSSPWQLLTSSISLLRILLNSGIDQTYISPSKSKEKSQQNFPISFFIPIISPQLVSKLLNCLDSRFQDVQFQSLELLNSFPAPLAGLESEENVKIGLIEKAIGLMKGSRECESEAAAGLFGLYRKIYVDGLGWKAPRIDSKEKANHSPSPQLDLIGNLLQFLDSQLEVAEEGNLLVAASSHPLHGTLISLQRLISSLDSKILNSASNTTDFRSLILRSKELIERVWKVTKVVLCSSSADGEWIEPTKDGEKSSTDHELSRVLLALSTTNHLEPSDLCGDSNPQETASFQTSSIAHAHESILTYSFRGMKEAASLMSVLLSCSVSIKEKFRETLWKKEEIKKAGEDFNIWMTQIRHRGAITTIFTAYSSLTSSILKCNWSEIQDLPDLWLSKFLTEIEDPVSASKISTTRQSAGLKYCVLALISGYPKSQNQVLAQVSKTLLEVIEKVIKDFENGGQQRKETCSGAIHSMNILKILLEDSHLGERMSSSSSNDLLGSLLVLTIKGFKSSVWDLRNSSMLLFSSCCQRAFPLQAKNKDLSSDRVNFREFFKKHEELGPFLKGQLEEVVGSRMISNPPNEDLGSSLAAILVIISRIQVEESSNTEEWVRSLGDDLARLTSACLASRIWKVREQAALALRSVVPRSQSCSSALKLLSAANIKDQNQLQGSLLAIQSLILNSPTHDSGSRQELQLAFEERSLDLLEENVCPATQVAYIKIAQLFSIEHGSSTWAYCKNLVEKADKIDEESQKEPMAPALLSLSTRVVLKTSNFSTILSLLKHQSREVRSEILESQGLSAEMAVTKSTEEPSDELLQLVASLQEMILNENEDVTLRSESARLLVEAWSDAERRSIAIKAFVSRHQENARQVVDVLCGIVSKSNCVPLSETVLPYLACLCSAATALDLPWSMDSFSKCCSLQYFCSDPNQSLPTRLSSVQALRALSPLLFPSGLDTSGFSYEVQASIFGSRTSLLDLLVDDDSDIRSEAATIAVLELVKVPENGNESSPLEMLKVSAATSGAASNVSSDRAWKWMEGIYQDPSNLMRKSWALYVWRLLLPAQDQIDKLLLPPKSSTVLFEVDPPNLFRNFSLDISRAFSSSRAALLGLGADFCQQELRRTIRSIEALQDRNHVPRNFEEAQRLRHLAFQLSLAARALTSFPSQLETSTNQEDANLLISALGQRYDVDIQNITTEAADDDERLNSRAGKDEETKKDGERKYRIAMISDFFFPNVGGVEGHIFAISQRLLARGHKVIIITHAYSPDRVGVRQLSQGLKVYYVPYQVIARQDTLPNFFSLFPLLRTILLRERIQIVHGHQALSSMAHEGILHSRPLGIKTVFTDHSLFGFADAASILTNKLLKFVLSDVDHVVCVSNTGKENTVLRASLDPTKVSVIPNAVVASQFAPDPSNADPSRVTIIILSRLMYRKGVDLLIAAIPRLCARHSDIHFLIGGDGPKRVELEQMREKYMLQDRVELAGAVRHGDHLTRGQIFLNTSLTEAFGTSIVEAACAGLFVVSTSVGGIPEVLPPEMTQLASPEEDDIVRAVEAALDHVRSGQHDPIAYHEVVKDMYSWSDVASRLETVYLNAMESEMPSFVERLEKYYAGGVIAGKVFCIIVAVDMLFLYLLEWLLPESEIDIAPDRRVERKE